MVLTLGAYSPPNQQPGALWQQLEMDAIQAANIDARNELREMIAWVSGNLVVGPQNRPNDPGNNFDFCAMRYRQQIDNNYPNYRNVWAGNNEQAKRDAIIALAGMGIEQGVQNNNFWNHIIDQNGNIVQPNNPNDNPCMVEQ